MRIFCIRSCALLFLAAACSSGDDAPNQTDATSSSDGTSADGSLVDDPFDGPSVCSSGENWTQGDKESPLMHPGGACITCHTDNDGPNLTLAGTVFETGHEPTDCNGGALDGGAVIIEVTDAADKVYELTANSSGNFYSKAQGITFPIRAKVKYDGRERAMAGAQPSGDCNSCHTDGGAEGAPGRIALP